MRRHRRVWVLCGMLCILLAGVGGGAALLAHPAHAQPRGRSGIARSSDIGSPSCYQWAASMGPDAGSNSTSLSALVAVPGSAELWTVGSYHNSSANFDQTFTALYDGASWSVVSSPNIASMENYLQGVAVVSASDVWAVGHYETLNGTNYQTLIEHWNGTAWSIVSSPSPGTFVQLYAVAAVAANNVWAVGTYLGSSTYQTLVEHWNGTSWSVVPSPNGSIASPHGTYSIGPGENYLYGISSVSASNIWAVGSDSGLTLVLHWDGSAWSLIPTPSDSAYDVLNAVAAISANDVMAVGYSDVTGLDSTLAEHWNGTSWSSVPTPAESGDNSMGYNAIAAVPGTKTYLAVGAAGNAVGLANKTSARIGSVPRMNERSGITGASNSLLMERWTGTAWIINAMPSPALYTTALVGVVARSATDLWAVGNYQLPHLILQTLIERYLPNAMGVIC